MTETPEAAAAAERARMLMESGGPSALVRRDGRVAGALPVLSPDDGALASWFVPVTVDDRLAGFFQFLPNLALMRWTTFQRREDSLAGCPPAAQWLDLGDVRRRAAALAAPGETAGDPSMSYDRVPDRLAWAVPLVSADGAARTVFVAGASVWPAVPGPPASFDGR